MSLYACLRTGAFSCVFITVFWLSPGLSAGRSDTGYSQEELGLQPSGRPAIVPEIQVAVDGENHPITAQGSSHDDKEHGHEQVEEDHHATEDEQHADENDEHAGENGVQLSEEQRRNAGIVVEVITLQSVQGEVEAPGEIHLNRYATHQVAPRIDAQVITRHARLGDQVKTGDPLVTLSSVAMSEAQGQLLTTENEWQRLKKMGLGVVSERIYRDAHIAVQLARASLLAYGMTEAQVNELANGNNVDQANGEFDLLAPSSGTVIRDDFISGQMVQTGSVLFQITDESHLWVEARLDPTKASHVRTGDPARVLAAGTWFTGKVIQVHHALDETTRTIAIRLEIANPDDKLHPGQFVTVNIQSGEMKQKGLILPLEAVLRSADGDWQVFVEHEPGKFEPQEVEVVRELRGQMQVTGFEPGSRIVTRGAFFVQSELSKSGFAVHNH